MKNWVGQLAYGIAGMQSIMKTEPISYKMQK